MTPIRYKRDVDRLDWYYDRWIDNGAEAWYREATAYALDNSLILPFGRSFEGGDNGQEDENGILFVCFPVTAIAAVLSRSSMTVSYTHLDVYKRQSRGSEAHGLHDRKKCQTVPAGSGVWFGKMGDCKRHCC